MDVDLFEEYITRFFEMQHGIALSQCFIDEVVMFCRGLVAAFVIVPLSGYNRQITPGKAIERYISCFYPKAFWHRRSPGIAKRDQEIIR
jgi:hypothetical protein